MREAVKRANLQPQQVDECIMGNVVSAGLGQNPARQAALFGGLAPEVGAMTINKVCGSGLKAVALAAQAVETGNSSIVVAGGMESMTNAPYLLPNARKGYRLGNGQLIDSMVHDGLWDIYNDYHMGLTGENVAEKYGITREEQDEFAVNSHRKAVAAQKECRFKSQIVPVEIPAKKKGQPPAIFVLPPFLWCLFVVAFQFTGDQRRHLLGRRCFILLRHLGSAEPRTNPVEQRIHR